MKPWVRQQALSTVLAGGVIACPTEAVWGLSCDPFNEEAVSKILQLKSRSIDKGLILVAADASQFDFLLKELTVEQREIILASWPGPYTWLVPHYQKLPYWICGNHDKVAIRVTAHPQFSELCQLCGPLVSTSANRSGIQAALNELTARRYFKNKVDFYLSGATSGNKSPSRIQDVVTGKVIR